MDNIIHPFQIPIYQSFIEQDLLTQIKEDTNYYIEKNPTKFDVKWYCPTKSCFINPKEPYFLKIKDSIKNHVSKYFDVWKFQEDINLKVDEIWINIASKDAYQEEHYHNSFFSGVLYLETFSGSGSIHFMNPLSTEAMVMNLPKTFDFAHKIQPTNGMILIFPSWLTHRVMSNNSNNNRITIAFNIQQIK